MAVIQVIIPYLHFLIGFRHIPRVSPEEQVPPTYYISALTARIWIVTDSVEIEFFRQLKIVQKSCWQKNGKFNKQLNKLASKECKFCFFSDG